MFDKIYLLPENYNFNISTLILEHIMGLSAIVFLNGALQNGGNFLFSTIVFDIHDTENVDVNLDNTSSY